jgi:hypothetical protein
MKYHQHPPEFKDAVIPQNFLFVRLANERKFMRLTAQAVSELKVTRCIIAPIWSLAKRKPNGIPDKIAFPRLKAGKSDFSGMTNLLEIRREVKRIITTPARYRER